MAAKVDFKQLDQQFAKLQAAKAKREAEEKAVEAQVTKAEARAKGIDKIPD
jgi:hypothetical protein